MSPGEDPGTAVVSPGNLRGEYVNRPRFGPLVVSGVLHLAAAFALLWFSGGSEALKEPSLYSQVIEPNKDHIIWYPLKEIPDVSPDTGDTDLIKAKTVHPNVIIHDAPDTAHDARLVLRDVPRKTPAKEVKVKDSIAVKKGTDTPVPAELPVQVAALPPPVPVKPEARLFVAPNAPPPPPPAQIRLVEEPPRAADAPKLAIPDNSSALWGFTVRLSRRFVPPPPAQRAGKAEGAGSNAALPDAPSLPGSGGASDINALIVNTVRGMDTAPPRPSAISAGPVTGSGADGRGGIPLAGVTLRPRNGAAEPEATLRTPKDPFKNPNGTAGPLPYVTTRIAPLEHTLSAPLPPSARNIPKSIEARFQGRVVYTMLLPMRGLPGYAGDWTIWFAERNAGGLAAPMRAPLPVRRPVRSNEAERAVITGVVQLSAILNKSGKIDSATLLNSPASGGPAAIEDLESWEFLPALRNREPVEMDLIVEIPFGANSKSVPIRLPVLPEIDRTPITQHN